MSIAIQANNVSMMFNMSSEKIDSIKEYLVQLVHHRLTIMNSGRCRISLLNWKKEIHWGLWD